MRRAGRPKGSPQAPLIAAAALLLFALSGPPPHAAAVAAADESARIAALGPWPPASVPRDASNPVSGQRAAITFGEVLFHTTRLARVDGVRCASCHEPWRQYTDGRARGFGSALGKRNTPTVLNVALHRVWGWEGANDSLWRQSIRPMLEAREMGADAGHVARAVRADPVLRALYGQAWGADPPADDERVLTDVAKALAAYQETLWSAPTRFDAHRDALARGDAAAAAQYPEPARRGVQLFIGRAGCVACHAGPLLSDSALHRSRVGTSAHQIRTPGLREVAATGPYMHDGSVANLCDAVRPHADAPQPSLTLADRRDLVAFLRTLSADAELPFVDAATFECR